MASKKSLLSLICLAALTCLIAGCSDDKTSNPVTAPVDTTPPALPAGLALELVPHQQTATITWQPNVSDLDLAGYLVYRSSYDLAAVALVTVPQTATYFNDDDIIGNGRLLTYYIYSVDTSGNISAAATIELNLNDLMQSEGDLPMEPER
ncbi:MAG: hypothetical protein PHQ53_12150 [Candidatus Krumholzibacteria bacterium]|nr:hypothetical protein [Candidatus Krumholzibacteria bacterium]